MITVLIITQIISFLFILRNEMRTTRIIKFVSKTIEKIDEFHKKCDSEISEVWQAFTNHINPIKTSKGDEQ